MGDVALEKGADLFVIKGWIYLIVRLLGFQVNLPPFFGEEILLCFGKGDRFIYWKGRII